MTTYVAARLRHLKYYLPDIADLEIALRRHSQKGWEVVYKNTNGIVVKTIPAITAIHVLNRVFESPTNPELECSFERPEWNDVRRAKVVKVNRDSYTVEFTAEHSHSNVSALTAPRQVLAVGDRVWVRHFALKGWYLWS